MGAYIEQLQGKDTDPKLPGFPILRSGTIASYPLTPVADFPVFYFDFSVYNGNSGGPVYVSRMTDNTGGFLNIHPISGIVGMVIQKGIGLSPEATESAGKPILESLNLGIVIQADAIKKLINSVPLYSP